MEKLHGPLEISQDYIKRAFGRVLRGSTATPIPEDPNDTSLKTIHFDGDTHTIDQYLRAKGNRAQRRAAAKARRRLPAKKRR